MSKSNRELIEEFRGKLTDGFHVVGMDRDAALRATKPWRQELWRIFNEIDARMVPVAKDGGPRK